MNNPKLYDEVLEMFGFTKGQKVRMLVKTIGCDEEDEERTFPVGAVGEICWIHYYGPK
ncbi:hypothetical protein K9B37_21775 [Microvirga sp. WGZ8]|uniref:Uncharacterized protein n=1 Tax=Microvirga puerhi TaxID=2876078 RepID=A0ABS7VTK9_9HYPH|nr:hypothetical protein [Microvirga puerhi]